MAVCSMQGSELELTDNMTTAEVKTDVRPAQFKWGKRFVWGAVGLVTLSAIIGWIIGRSGTAALEPGPSFDNNTSNFIVGGQDAREGEWPFMVSVQEFDDEGRTSTHFCGGSLINRRWVLSAAHCFRNIRPGMVNIVLGKLRLMDPVYIHRYVGEIVFHPEDDLALLKLIDPVVYSDTIQRVCLADSGSSFPSDTPSWMLGWGNIRQGVPPPDPEYLQQLHAPVVSNPTCRRYHGDFVTDKKICAGSFPDGKSACDGDSGGPLVTKLFGTWIQSGVITEVSNPCGRANHPTICVRVDKFKKWISDATDGRLCFMKFTPKVAGAESSSTHPAPSLPAVGSVPEPADTRYVEGSVEE